MILRRVIAHFRKQEWTAIAIDFVIVVAGVFIGVQVSNWNEGRADRARTRLIVEALRQDLRDSAKVEQRFIAETGAGLAAFDAARARGERPAPYYFRVGGSDRAPTAVWHAATQSRLADLIHPGLLFDTGFFYSERDGVSDKFERYQAFVETEILPQLEPGADPDAFYDATGGLRPQFAANMNRLREWRSFLSATVRSAYCLDERLAAPTQPGPSCRPDYTATETAP